jgi:hypothetical protein
MPVSDFFDHYVEVYSIFFDFLLLTFELLLQFAAQELVQCRNHTWNLGFRSFDLELQTRVSYGFRGVASKRPDIGAVLCIAGEIIKKALYTAWCEETNDIECVRMDILDLLIADRAIHIRGLKLTLVILKPAYDLIVLLVFRTGVKEFFVLLMFIDHIKKALVGTIGTIKNLALSVKNELLKI